MALHLDRPVVWQKSLSLDRGGHLSTYEKQHAPAASPFLYSARLKESLQESRKAFLNLSLYPGDIDCQEKAAGQDAVAQVPQQEPKKAAPLKKISYKTRRSSSLHRKTSGKLVTAYRNSTVAELASKFDRMVIEKKSSILDDPKFARIVKRANSQRDAEKVARKPSVKMKQQQHSFKTEEKTLYITRRSSVVRKVSIKKLQKSNSFSKTCVRAKIGYLEKPHLVMSDKETEQSNASIQSAPRPPSVPKKPTTRAIENNNVSVRAAIEIFEKRTSPPNDDSNKEAIKPKPTAVPKPKVPEKKFNPDLIASKKLFRVSKQPDIIPQVLTTTDEKTDFDFDDIPVQIVNIPITTPTKRCDSSYETLKIKKSPLPVEELKPNASFLWRHSTDKLASPTLGRPVNIDEQQPPAPPSNSWEELYDLVEPPKIILKKKMPEPKCDDDEKIYEELSVVKTHNYEYCKPSPKYEDLEQNGCDDGYEAVNPVLVDDKENIYETLPSVVSTPPPPLLPRRQEEPLPPRPPSKNSYYTMRNSGEEFSNCYESIYNVSAVDLKLGQDHEVESNYESIYGCNIAVENWGTGSNRDSIVSSEQQSNSLYGRSVPSWTEEALNYKTISVSSSDRSDDWIDMSDNEEDKINPGFILSLGDSTRDLGGFFSELPTHFYIYRKKYLKRKKTGTMGVREKQKISKKTSAWSQQLREQWTKKPKNHAPNEGETDSDHHYESLYNGRGESHCDSDSFDSDSDCSFVKENMRDSGVDMASTQLPEPPNNQPYVLTRLAASAGKHMKRLRRNWSMTKNDISKSLSRMTKRKSRTDLDSMEAKDDKPPPTLPSRNQKPKPETSESTLEEPLKSRESQTSLHSYQNVSYSRTQSSTDNSNDGVIYEKQKSSNKKGFLRKFRRSMSMSAESASELTQNLTKPKSTFYLTEVIDIDGEAVKHENETEPKQKSLSPPAVVKTKSKSSPVRPQNPPPPLPVLPPPISPSVEIRKLSSKNDPKRATSWYAEVGLFNNAEMTIQTGPRRPNTFWYAEVGLYQTGTSTPSSSSAENSGNGSNLNVKNNIDLINQENSEEYYNLKNENDYYNDSIGSCSSADTKMDKSLSSASGEMQLLLQEEPLYQFYDAAVMESVCQGGTSDLDYDGYEEVGTEQIIVEQKPRPTAMELIAPVRNNVSVSRTLWCEIPEVKQSTVLSTLSLPQKKVQEAKFEMMTSEASYLNSLNVLTNHFIKYFSDCECLSGEEKEVLFSKIPAVKNCSEKLLLDLEKCWQDNILLHGVCEIVHKHAEENFYVYVTYCENQITLDSILRKLKDRQAFNDTLRQLESSTACQALTLYSFLMLPMQRITRWPLLLDAVLKRLAPQDDEYLHCQYALTTINKIVNQCNEGARKVEREAEMKEIVRQIEFPKDMKPMHLISGSRWLVRSGPVTQMVSRGDDVKLTFGKRFTKLPLFLFLFNDLFLVTKYRSNEDNYLALHYCPRSLLEISKDSVSALPAKDTQGRNLMFLTMLENQDEKLIELMLSCNSDSDKERWLSAILPRQSEDPEETLYECWDCPQVTAIHNYTANQPDELPVSRGDIINVNRKMTDGWYHGERIRDGQTGWFPSNYVEEIANPHVRARNLKQRYRLLAFSESYLKTK